MSDTKGDRSSEGVPCFGPQPGGRASRHVQVPAPADFTKWARRDRWGIAEGAMLILGLEPFALTADWLQKATAPGFADIYETASRSDGLRAQGHWVSPRDFLAWAREKEYPVPPELGKAVNRFHPKPKDRPQRDADGPKWPWGSYETELLRHLAAAADRFWKLYDPSDQKAAPLSKEVAGWLEDKGVRPRNAESIARILHPKGLPTGPRKKKSPRTQ